MTEDEMNDFAYDYALDQSGGETTGCSAAAPGPESESNPGCIFSVAFAGCQWGLTGEELGPVPIEEEFPLEPALIEIYNDAREKCADEI